MSIDSAVAAHEQFHGSYDDRLHVWMASETPRGQDEAGFAAIGQACFNHKIRLTVHCAEAARDVEMIREAYNATPAQFLDNVHSTGPHVVLGHMTHLDVHVDLDILSRTGTSVAHNPTSNAKLADGIAPVPQMLAAGVNVCIGSDGAPCNNNHDLLRDMHLAGVIHKGKHMDASLLSSEQVLEMATINAAKALGVDADLGSLEAGKKADFVVIDPSGLHAAPYDVGQLGEPGGIHPSTLVVHSCSGNDVVMVVIDGQVVLEERRLTKVDEDEIKAAARKAIQGIRQRSGVKAQPMKLKWQYV
jgi:cytosine/adenosine deaminase-related metal-dependent hydrolase